MIRSRRAAFTLLELMIVVVIIGILVGLAAPGIMGSMRQKEMNAATLDLVRGLTRARAEAMGYGRASLVRVTPAPGLNGRGGYDLYRGTNNSCQANAWPAIVGGGCAGNQMCREQYDPAGGSSSVNIQLGIAGGQPMLDLCFEPNGTLWWRQGIGDPFTDQNTVNGGFVFTITRPGSNEVVRQVVLPLGGAARVLR